MLHEYGLTGSRAVLIRPDGHISARLAGNAPVSELNQALADILHKTINFSEVYSA
jgi:hypothetical protein